MEYTVCYAKYCSKIIEANDPDEAIDKLDPDENTFDDWEVTLVLDENGRELRY